MKQLLGMKFGRLRVLREAGRSPKGLVLWECKCDCGKYLKIKGTYLTGGTESCGCLVKERLQAQGSHNHCRRGEESPTWRSWKSMLGRTRPTHKSHAYYYDKGITVYPEWREFSIFLSDVGERPLGTTLDRVDGSKGYTPENCRWATNKEQGNNKACIALYTYDGATKSLTDWSNDSRCVVTTAALYARVLKYNVPIDKALTIPNRGRLK